MKKQKYILVFVTMLFAGVCFAASKTDPAPANENHKELDIKGLILEHLGDSYEWHITTINHKHISIPLPVILYSKTSGWNVFLSSKLQHGEAAYKGFYLSEEGSHKGKIVEKNTAGEEVRPFDISITKNVLSLFISCTLLLIIILSVARSYKKEPLEAKKGFAGMMEMFIMNINDDVIKPGIGKDYKKYAPYLLTVFFFIFINNLMGLIPIFPGGANLTGNIAITFLLAFITFLIVNISGTKEYYKDIFWPDVPTWLKVPVPLMPAIELVGVFTKPFALMIRLFANILAGHSIVLGLTALVFVTVSLGTAMNATMSVISVIFTIFIDFVELLVAYIQAYVFTMLSSVFIGLARIEPHHEKKLEN
jgi:F-type H+-transporting ATPase subunit a